MFYMSGGKSCGEPWPDGFQAFIHNIPGGLLRLSTGDFGFEFVNEGYCEMLGYPADEFHRVFHGFLDTVAQEDRDVVRELFLASAGQDSEAEFRAPHKSGRNRWFLAKFRFGSEDDGSQKIYCLVADVTASKQVLEMLRVSEERHRVILEQSEDIIFEWNLAEDTVEFSPNWYRKFHRAPVTRGFAHQVVANGNVHPDDVPRFQDMIQRIQAGERYAQEEIRLRDRDEHFLWCRMRMTALYDGIGRVANVVGAIIDIDGQKREEERLLLKSQRDPLTHLYNRDTARTLIEEELSKNSGGVNAMFVMDVDHFKVANDTMGHLFGDAVLSDFAERIGNVFRPGDILGRIGGDEFMVFAAGLPGRKTAIRKAEQILKALADAPSRHGGGWPLSASIGVAVSPEDGGAYTELFKHADAALYEAKNAGRGCYVMYSEDLAATQTFRRIEKAEVSEAVQNHGTAENELSARILHILYETKDILHSIQIILEIVGRYYGVSRAYIFERGVGGAFSNTFEWCGEQVPPQKHVLQNIDLELYGNYHALFDDNGVFYCRDIGELDEWLQGMLAPQGIHSMLQCAILDDGEFRGFVGFDECSGSRLWTQSEINTLNLCAQIVSAFLLKKRAGDELAAANELTKTVLDQINAWIYVVEDDTYLLRYLNHPAKAAVPEAREGARCFEALMGREEPCPACPIAGTKQGGTSRVTVDKARIGGRLYAPASHIEWKGRGCSLLCCFDITRDKADGLEELE